MRIGMIGLGRMGGNMVGRLVTHGHEVVVHDLDPEVTARVGRLAGATAAGSFTELMGALQAPRVVWLMVPAGDPTEQTLAALAEHADAADILVDGGNSRYTDTRRRAGTLEALGVRLVDVGTSGGLAGGEAGYCLMVGGDAEAVRTCEPLFDALAMPDGYAHVGPTGAGHYAKMVHNGIEYGLLQAYAEGFELLHASSFDYDLQALAALWNRGSVVRSWLLELLESAYAREGQDLEEIRGWVEDSGEGRWTIETAIDLDVPTPVMALALLARFRSRQPESYAAQVVAALRKEFGGHAVKE